MKKILLSFICLTLAMCVPNIVFSQPGTLDKSFGDDGRVIVSGTNQYRYSSNGFGSIAIQKDGKILIAGGAVNYATNMKGFAVVRINPDGSLDKSFSDDGKAFAEVANSYANPWDMCIAPDGKIIVTGDVRNSSSNGEELHRFAAVRFNVDGTLDKSFDGNGIVLLDEAKRGEFSTSVAVQDDGKLLLAGYGVNPKTNDYDFKIIHLNENGSIDTGFGDNGILFIGIMGTGRKIRLQPDKKIVISGDSNDDFAIVRLNPDGSPDTSFGSGGKTYIDFDGNNDYVYDLVIQDDGKILVSGTTYIKNTSTGISDYALARINANGTLDSSFAVNGRKTIDFSNADDQGSSVAVQKNGSIIMVGSTPTGIGPSPNISELKIGIVRLLPDGNLDTAFDIDGKRLLDFGTSNWGFGVLIQPDEKIVVGGAASRAPALARLISDNSISQANLPPSFTIGVNPILLEDHREYLNNWATNITAGKGEDNQRLSFIINRKNIDLFQRLYIDELGTLSLEPKLNTNGSDTITLILKDNGGTDNGGIDQSNPQTFIITVLPVNDPPTFALNSISFVTKVNSGPQSVKEWASELSKGPENESGQKLQFLVSNNNNRLFSIQPSIDTSGTLKFTAAKNATGTAKVTVILKDDGGTTNGGIDQSPLTFSITINPENAKSGALYSTTPKGGTEDGGTIIKFVPGSNELSVVKSFEGLALGTSRLIQASDGKLYGMVAGGSIDRGVIFSFDPLTKIYIRLSDFDSINGASEGYLLQASDGKLYGVTSSGGVNNLGVIFSFDLSSSTYKKLVDFDGLNGSQPTGSLIQARDGKLYGLTLGGGTNRDGVIFSFDPSSSAFTKLKDFNETDGANPYASLLQATDGKLYGASFRGGSNGFGVVFSFDPSNSTYIKIHDFDHINGGESGFAGGSLVQAANGNLYGFAGGGKNERGVLFSINPSSQKFTNEKDFSTTNPGSTFTLINDGKLVGVADSILFSFDPLTSEYRILKNFGNKNNSPAGRLLQAKDGKLYGTGSRAGFFQQGVIFSFDLSDYSYNILHESGLNQEGSQVTGSLVRANNGKLYGMTTLGGTLGYGVIFSFDPATSTYAKLKDFDHMNGANPRGGLMQADDGKLYGMTETGGTNNKGVIFSFDPASSRYVKLKDFTGPYDVSPVGSLIQANDGKLYGMSRGTIFSFNPTSSIYSTLMTFKEPCQDCDIGQNPMGNLIQANDGIMYGMTESGGSEGDGTVFSFNPVTSSYYNFINFHSHENPRGSLIQANDAKLYGMNYGGGGCGVGEIFSIDLPPTRYRVDVASFCTDITSGIYPSGTLLQASDGYLYGTTSKGGVNKKGIIFSLDISTGIVTKLQDFTGDNGAFPGIGSSFIEVCGTESNTAPVLTAIGNKSANELKKLSFTAKATDKDSPANTLIFSLANPATGKFPEGATINQSTGLFTWTPTEVQGPGTFRVRINVSDGTCTDEEEIEIKVCEINAEPVLSAIGNKTVNEGFGLTFTAAATDSDLPANILTYSISKTSQGNFPTGAVIHPSGGQFTWTPSEDQGPGIYHVKIIVSDGSCIVSEEIRITVNEVNSAPSFTKGPDQILYENAGPQVVPLWATHISKGDPGEEKQAVNFTVSNTNKNLFSVQPTISPDGTLSFTPAINACGSATLNVILKDDGGTEFGGINQSPPQTFTITIKTSKIILSAYPNPFGKNAVVTFTLPADENLVILDVYDLKGSRVKRMYEGRADADQTLKFEFDGSNLSSGIYLLRLATSKNVENFKIIMTE